MVNSSGTDLMDLRQFTESTFPIESIDGSKDGEIINATAAREHIEVPGNGHMNEVYERQSDQPP